jgi:hypothetical protein
MSCQVKYLFAALQWPKRRLGKTQELPVFARSISLTICNSSIMYILDFGLCRGNKCNMNDKLHK